MKKILMVFVLACALTPSAQSQHIAFKTNTLGWAAAVTLNAGFEVALAPKWTLDLDGLYNPWSWGNNKKSEAWGLQLEGRYWFCHKFTGHFIGLHTQYGSYDCGMWKYNYQGWITGAGFSYGYALPISNRWRMEFNLGIGYTHKDYDLTNRIQDRDQDVVFHGNIVKNQFGITRAGINFVFLIR